MPGPEDLTACNVPLMSEVAPAGQMIDALSEQAHEFASRCPMLGSAAIVGQRTRQLQGQYIAKAMQSPRPDQQAVSQELQRTAA